MDRKFDLAVIGMGVAATIVAGKCRGTGWSVAIVDELPFGGTCALRGCDPKVIDMSGWYTVERVGDTHAAARISASPSAGSDIGYLV